MDIVVFVTKDSKARNANEILTTVSLIRVLMAVNVVTKSNPILAFVRKDSQVLIANRISTIANLIRAITASVSIN
jgi:hypothetical protein